MGYCLWYHLCAPGPFVLIHIDNQDKIDDLHAGVKSSALYLGDNGTKPALVVLAAAFFALLAYSVHAQSPIFAPMADSEGTRRAFKEWVDETFAHGHPFFAVSWLGAIAHMSWQIRTVILNNRMDCWAKFCSNRNLGLIVFAGLAADYLYQTYRTGGEEEDKLIKS